MTILEQYRQSLKATETEEVLDLFIYRPLAFLFVKAVYYTSLTPNQTSLFAMLVGVAAGVFFGFGQHPYLILGGVLYFVCNVLDCADGQIARLKGTGTKTGRIIDGCIDYVVSTAIFVGIGIALKDQWILTVAAGFSSAVQSFLFDFYRNKYLEIVYGKFLSLEAEIEEFKEEQRRIEGIRGKGIDRFLIWIYLIYCGLQLKLQRNNKGNFSSGHVESKEEATSIADKYARKNKILIRMWSFAGSTTHITVCILVAFMNNLEVFLWICAIPLNVLIVVLYLWQRLAGTEKGRNSL